MDKFKNFWARLFGNLVKGDIIQVAKDTPRERIGIYYAHYELDGQVHLFLLYDISGGTNLIEHLTIPKKIFKEIIVLHKAEEFTDTYERIKFLQEMVIHETI